MDTFTISEPYEARVEKIVDIDDIVRGLYKKLWILNEELEGLTEFDVYGAREKIDWARVKKLDIKIKNIEEKIEKVNRERCILSLLI